MFKVTVPPTTEQGSYATNATNRTEARARLKEYRENESVPFRLVCKRVPL